MKLLFIITSSIAAIKSKKILEKLSNKNVYINCVVTENTKKIINHHKLKAVINGRVYTDKSEKNNKMLHIKLTRKADIVVVCPATANTIAKYANGYGDNLASTTLLASNKQIIFVPAMNTQMWNNKINKKNVNFLINSGVEFIGPKFGNLSCGEIGIGRMENTNIIINTILSKLNNSKIFKGKKCLVTAGPTIEKIDPVRFISNYSSGKQGYEIANQIALLGGSVTLISGPTTLQPPHNVKLIKIRTAKEMYNEIKKIKKIDLGIFSAAVSDYKVGSVYKNKLKKNDFNKIKFNQNIDILKQIGNSKKYRPKLLVGFAAETNNIIGAKKKLLDKNCDVIIYNKINNSNKVFGLDYNKIKVITQNKIVSFPKMSKTNCAKKIVEIIKKNYYDKL